jgi:dihydrofolate reductase
VATGLGSDAKDNYNTRRSHGRVKEGEYGQTLNQMPKFVASRTLKEPLEWNATLLQGDIGDAVAELKRQVGRDIVTYGSAALMATLMETNLIDEYRIWIHPFVIGTGTRLFAEGCRPATWSSRSPERWAPEW